MRNTKGGILALEDGSIFRGKAFGKERTVTGEAVFNTSMTGYQEVLTDPSYFSQIVVMTAPQMGNYGINSEDSESDGPKVSAFVVRECSKIASSWRSEQTLNDYLKDHNTPALEGVDTRAITKRLRCCGAMKACLSTEDISDEEALRLAREWPGLKGVDLVKKVTCQKSYSFNEPPPPSFSLAPTPIFKKKYHVVAFDFGIKRSILHQLIANGFRATVVPADTPPAKVHELNPDALFLSNGPGDPSPLHYAHKTISALISHYPIFGICMGHQIISHSLGAPTFKLKFGHRGANQPVKNLETGKVTITAQNHGFATCEEALKDCGVVLTEVNLNDGTVEGLRHKEYPLFSVQYHPEGAPGPTDAHSLFGTFYAKVAEIVG